MPLVFVKQLGIMTLLLVSLLATSTFAETYCKADYSDAVSDINQARTECETAEGGGSTFYVSEIVKDSSCTESYDGGESITFAGWRYLLGCDMCTSQNAKKELNDFSETCQAQCKVSDYKCSYTMWSWGDNHFTQKICGKTARFLAVRRAVRARRKARPRCLTQYRAARPVLERKFRPIPRTVRLRAEAELRVLAVRGVRGNTAMWSMRLKGNLVMSEWFSLVENGVIFI